MTELERLQQELDATMQVVHEETARAARAEREAENWKRLLCEASSRLIAPQKPAE
jgi:hypothetical protein